MSTKAPPATEVITFGCRLNAYESEVIRDHADAAGRGDTIVVNTCAVTAEAERQARQAIRKARRRAPGARIVVTGCAAQIDPQTFAAMPEVDAVLGNAEKLDPASYLGPPAARVRVNDIMAVRETAAHLIAGFAGRARAFVQVQNGCDHRCTFCVIPFGRGPSRSVPVGAVVAQTRRLVAAGYREAVLTGVDLTAYGADLPGRPTLGRMVRRLLDAVPGLARLRLSSIDVAEVDDDLIRLIAEEPRLMPHLHLSLQSGDDLVLKRMKRRHDRASAIAFCDRVRALRPDVVFGADLIAGFPTESEAMFRRSLDLIAEAGLVHLHVFPYSARRGTPAARMPQVATAVRKQRAARLRAAGEAALAGFLASCVGRHTEVLVERAGEGRSPQFAPVRLGGDFAPGALVDARVTGVADGALIGEPLVGRAA
ncbi:MAG: tRNA (N(6)-L-threonylcarbamoyladenosine(37)-C(2))-methylthiotransferase MtaB [Alphaproteobacteria bacterium]